MTEPREIPDSAWSPRGDRMLALLPTEHPYGFNDLPFEEQQWRGRIFLMQYTITGSIPYSWWSAMAESDPGAPAFAMAADEEEIIFRLREAKAGRWYGPPENAEAPAMSAAPGAPGPS